MKDKMIIWYSNEIKSKLHKYYLPMLLRETYKIFEELLKTYLFQNFVVWDQKMFCFLKNFSIDQCKYKLHENFRLKLKGLNWCMMESGRKIIYASAITVI